MNPKQFFANKKLSIPVVFGIIFAVVLLILWVSGAF